jgi:hypothetical protein
MRFEDPNDPERSAARDFGFTRDGCTSWFLEDRQESIEIVQRPNGELCAHIEDFNDE